MAQSTLGNDAYIERTGVAGPLTASLRRVSWGAILVGVVVSLAIQVLLAMLGAGIGTAVIEPVQAGENPAASTLGISAAIWWAASGIVAAFIGGWVASRLAGIPSREAGVLHGLGTWAATTLLVLYLLGSTATAILGGAFNLVGQTVSGLGNVAGNAASAVGQVANPLQAIQDEVQAATNPDDPQAIGRQIATAVGRMLTSEGDAATEARQTAIDLMVRQGVPQPEAEQRIAQWEQSYRQTVDQAQQQARTAADATADGAATAALYGFIALLLGAIAGIIGGRAGTPRLEAVVAETTRVSGSRNRVG